jgi:lipoate-protein ligase A
VASVWRLLNTGLADGATNMAIDEAILRAVQASLVHPTLRFYGWLPACLSLGQAQAAAEVDFEACRALGVDVVRRSTPESDPHVAGDIVTSYRKLSAGLLEGLRILNVPGIQSNPKSEISNLKSEISPVCFEAPSHYEITVNGKKLVGSAQMRRGGIVLQHGAIPLVGDIARICPLLVARPDPAHVRARAATVEAVLGYAVSLDEAARAVAQGFARALDIQLEPGSLTPQEQRWAGDLRRDKYGSDEWTKRI